MILCFSCFNMICCFIISLLLPFMMIWFGWLFYLINLCLVVLLRFIAGYEFDLIVLFLLFFIDLMFYYYLS